MKKIPAVAVLAGLLSAGTVVPAQAEPTDPAPTNVRISWKDETFQFVHVTWDEDSPRPNVIYLRPVSYTTKKSIKYLPADAPNEIDLPALTVRRAGYKLVVDVAAGTQATGETSPAADSVAFDTIPVEPPTIESVAISGTSTVQVAWKPGVSLNTDSTPGDPLDRDLPVSYQPVYRTSVTMAGIPIGSPTTGTSLTFSEPKPSYGFSIQARNEWPEVPESESVGIGQMELSASVPAWVVADQNTVINGTWAGPGTVPITLQARSSETSAWYVVGSKTFTGGTYQFTMPSRGTRQYRVISGNVQTDGMWFGKTTATVTTTTQLKATVALGASTVKRSSTPVNAALTVNPASTGTASLQRWNGSTWVAVAGVPFTSGRGTGHLSAATAGTFTYRYYVPAQTFNGLSVAAAYSPNFTLKVNP